MNVEAAIGKISNTYREARTAWKRLPSKTRLFITGLTIGGTMAGVGLACFLTGGPSQIELQSNPIGDSTNTCPTEAYTLAHEMGYGDPKDELCDVFDVEAKDSFFSNIALSDKLTSGGFCDNGITAFKITNPPRNENVQIKFGEIIEDLGNNMYGVKCSEDIDGDGIIDGNLDPNGDGIRGDTIELAPNRMLYINPNTGEFDVNLFWSINGFNITEYRPRGIQVTKTPTLSAGVIEYLTQESGKATQTAESVNATQDAYTDTPAPTITPSPTLNTTEIAATATQNASYMEPTSSNPLLQATVGPTPPRLGP